MSDLVPLPRPFDRSLSEWSVDELRAWRGRLYFAVNNQSITNNLKAEMAAHFNAMAHELKRRGLVPGEFKTMDVGLPHADDDIPVYLSETPCKICGDNEFYAVAYRPDRSDSYRICVRCGTFLGDEIVSKE